MFDAHGEKSVNQVDKTEHVKTWYKTTEATASTTVFMSV